MTCLLLLVALAASPRVLVVGDHATQMGDDGAVHWQGPALVPILCLTDGGVSADPGCLANAPATANLAMLDGTTRTATGKRTALTSQCATVSCPPETLWTQPRSSRFGKFAARVGWWPAKSVTTFRIVAGASDVALPSGLVDKPARALPSKRPSDQGPAPAVRGEAFSFTLADGKTRYDLLLVGAALAHRVPGEPFTSWRVTWPSASERTGRLCDGKWPRGARNSAGQKQRPSTWPPRTDSRDRRSNQGPPRASSSFEIWSAWTSGRGTGWRSR